jgi:hypothetical protein
MQEQERQDVYLLSLCEGATESRFRVGCLVPRSVAARQFSRDFLLHSYIVRFSYVPAFVLMYVRSWQILDLDPISSSLR